MPKEKTQQHPRKTVMHQLAKRFCTVLHASADLALAGRICPRKNLFAQAYSHSICSQLGSVALWGRVTLYINIPAHHSLNVNSPRHSRGQSSTLYKSVSLSLPGPCPKTKRRLKRRVADDLRLEVGPRRARQQLCVKLKPRGHPEAPLVSDLRQDASAVHQYPAKCVRC